MARERACRKQREREKRKIFGGRGGGRVLGWDEKSTASSLCTLMQQDNKRTTTRLPRMCTFRCVCVCVRAPGSQAFLIIGQPGDGRSLQGKFFPRHWKGDVTLLAYVHTWIGFTSPLHKGNCADTGELLKCLAAMAVLHFNRWFLKFTLQYTKDMFFSMLQKPL